MSSFLVRIVKEFAGEEWEQTYCVQAGASTDPGFSEDDWDTATGAVGSFTDANTKPTDGTYLGGSSLIHALIGFERTIHYNAVNFVRVFAWDGIANAPDDSTFTTAPLGFTGLRTLPGGGLPDVAPGNVAWLIAKRPGDFGVRSGRASYRLCLADYEVKPAGKRLLDWTSNTEKTAAETRLSDAVADSLLGEYMIEAEIGDNAVLAIPQYWPDTAPLFPGSLRGSHKCNGLVSRYPQSRQVARGRKRKVAA